MFFWPLSSGSGRGRTIKKKGTNKKKEKKRNRHSSTWRACCRGNRKVPRQVPNPVAAALMRRDAFWLGHRYDGAVPTRFKLVARKSIATTSRKATNIGKKKAHTQKCRNRKEKRKMWKERRKEKQRKGKGKKIEGVFPNHAPSICGDILFKKTIDLETINVCFIFWLESLSPRLFGDSSSC